MCFDLHFYPKAYKKAYALLLWCNFTISTNFFYSSDIFKGSSFFRKFTLIFSGIYLIPKNSIYSSVKYSKKSYF